MLGWWRKYLLSFEPGLFVDKVQDIDIDLAVLHEAAIEGILVDIDGTMALLNHHEVKASVVEWYRSVKTLGFPIRPITCNCERSHLGQIEQVLGDEPIQRLTFEPFRGFLCRAATTIGCEPNQALVINDSLIMLRIFKPLGCFTVKVDSIDDGQLQHNPTGYAYRIGQWVERKLILPALAEQRS